jgi:hypothetical protein
MIVAGYLSNETIAKLAQQIDPDMLAILRQIEAAGSIHNRNGLDPGTADVLQQLVGLGLVDAGRSKTADGLPLIWISNQNGRRVVRRLRAG